MKIDIIDMDELISLNKLSEITSPILFTRAGVPDPNGLVSNEIFGVNTTSRKETFAYIDLHGPFFNPHVYKVIRRMYRKIDKIVNGEDYVSLDKDGRIVDDEYGETGIRFLYDNWDRINWTTKAGTSASRQRQERESLLQSLKKNEIFMTKQIVLPAFYRDVTTNSGAGAETGSINNLYSRLIRLASTIENQSLFQFQFNGTNYNIQQTILEVYDYFKVKIEKKGGLIRKYLMGKSCDYCVRTVITNATYHANRPEELFVDFKHTAIPMAQVCSLAYPFVLRYVKAFFERELIDNKTAKLLYDPSTDSTRTMELKDPESYYSEKYITRRINMFIRDPESRFDPIEVPTKERERMYYLYLTGKRTNPANTSELSTIMNRRMTWTDLLYMACVDVVKDKHCMITRYPINDEYNIFSTRIRVSSTIKTMPVMINEQIYEWYPVVDFTVDEEKIPSLFNDATEFSNAYLDGIDGDYDGDQTTEKIAFTQEANADLDRFINSKGFFIGSDGGSIRNAGKEATQTFFVMTKNPDDNSREVSDKEKKEFIDTPAKDITFDLLLDWFSDTVDNSNGTHNVKQTHSRFRCTDTISLTVREYPPLKTSKLDSIHTTLGRLVFYRVLAERQGLEKFLPFPNTVLTKKAYGAFDSQVTSLLREDKITTDTMGKYICARDWLGLQLHAVVTSSFTPGTIKMPKSVIDLKKKLIKQYEKELNAKDPRAMEEIEKQLIAKAKEELNGDIGLDLYISGARGSIDNHLKNMFLTRGAVPDSVHGGYQIILNSLMDGLAKENITEHANAIVQGAYPKSIETADSGYLSKEILAFLQTETLAPEGSDCGTKGYRTMVIPAGTKKDYLNRYIIEGDKLVHLNTSNIDKYVGKKVKLRSPLYCIGTGKNKILCEHCCGNFYLQLGKSNIGLHCSKVGTTITQLNLQKFHQNLVKSKKIDIHDMLV